MGRFEVRKGAWLERLHTVAETYSISSSRENFCSWTKTSILTFVHISNILARSGAPTRMGTISCWGGLGLWAILLVLTWSPLSSTVDE